MIDLAGVPCRGSSTPTSTRLGTAVGDELGWPGITRQAADGEATLFAGSRPSATWITASRPALRDAIARDEIVGPTILAAGWAGSPGGACDLVSAGSRASIPPGSRCAPSR
jgi:hypothetical protein